MSSVSVPRRLDELERQVRLIQDEIASLRSQIVADHAEPAAPQPAPRTVAPEPSPRPLFAPAPTAAAAAVPARSPSTPSTVRRVQVAAPSLPKVDLADLLGARALALAGGVVTLLGVVFLFVLAVNRGWIGPVERVALGGLASAVVFAAGLFARSRYGQLHAAYAATGAGLAGGYATLLAAAALYELVPDAGALAIAAGIAAVGVSVSLAWSAQTIAGLGLIGAMLVPAAMVLEGGLSVLGTAFVAIVFAATALVALERRWRELLAAGALVSGAQIVALVLDQGEGAPGRVVVLATVFWLLYFAVSILRQLRSPRGRLDALATSLLLGSGGFAGLAATALLNGETLGIDRQGGAILVAAATYGAAAAAYFPRARTRDLSALLTAVALALGAIGLGLVLGGASLAVAWAAEAAALAWLASRVGETRFQLGAVAYLGLAAGHALTYEAPLTDLYQVSDDPGTGAPTVAAVALAAVVFARCARRWAPLADPGDRIANPIVRLLSWFAELRPFWRAGAFAAAAVLALYAGALALLELHDRTGMRDAFEWGHVSVSAFWAAAAVGAILAGAALRRRPLEVGGFVWLALTLGSFGVVQLPEPQRGWATLVLAAAFLCAGFVRELVDPTASSLRDVSRFVLAVSPVLAGFSILTLVETGDAQGAAFLGAAAVYGALAATVFRRAERRDLSTLLWAIVLALALPGSFLLLEGTWLAVSWSIAGAALAALAALTGERRFQAAALAYVGLALVGSLLVLAPVTELLLANRTPADGVPALMASVAALAVLALLARTAFPPARDVVDETIDDIRLSGRAFAFWSVGILSLYAASLTILGAFQLGDASVDTAFQRGHTAVSACWGLVGLVTLYLGLTRRLQALRLAGFGLFGLSLAKLFLYDLSTLSSIARALSFLAVGAVLLLGGFFYQRLSGATEDRCVQG